jgi:hypothetical protein
VQSTHKIAGKDAGGYATYLTSESDRGDYYVDAEDGEGEGARGEWHGSPAVLASLGLSADSPVGRDQLVSLMNGQAPRRPSLKIGRAHALRTVAAQTTLAPLHELTSPTLLVRGGKLPRLDGVEHRLSALGPLGEQHASQCKFRRRVLIPWPDAFAIGHAASLGQVQVLIADLLHLHKGTACNGPRQRHDINSTISAT